MSPEWAPGESDPKSPEFGPAPIGPEAPLAEGSRRKVLRSRVLLELMLAGKSVLVLLLVPDSVPSVARMARPPVLFYRAEGVHKAP